MSRYSAVLRGPVVLVLLYNVASVSATSGGDSGMGDGKEKPKYSVICPHVILPTANLA
jgi:hypothetical protein